MPLKRSGSRVLHKVGGKWKVRANCKSAQNAKNYIKAVHANKKKK